MATIASVVRTGTLVPYDDSARSKAVARTVSASGVLPDWEEAWRQIYTPLLLQQGPERTRLVSVSSALDGEGKTTVAMGLAVTIADDLDTSVLLIDCNLLRPTLSEEVGLGDAHGVADWLGLDCASPGKISLDTFSQPTSVKNLWVIPAGRRVANPSKLLRSASMADFLQQIRARYDFVIMDTPSILSSSDTRLLTYCSDALLFVVRTGASTTKSVSKALGMVQGVSNRGIVMNDFQTAIPRPLQRFFVC